MITPYPGFDPLDGDDPRVSLSADSPCRARSIDRSHQLGSNQPDSGGDKTTFDHGPHISAGEAQDHA